MSSGETNPDSGQDVVDPKSLRGGYWENLSASVSHIRESVSIEGRRLRGSDYLSIALLPLAAISLAVCSSNPAGLSVRPYLVAFFVVVLLYFIGGRVGIVRPLTTRQTHLFFTISFAAFLLGCVFSLLVLELCRIF